MLLVLKDGEVVIVAVRALMPHQFTLPADEKSLQEAAALLAEGTKFGDLPAHLQQVCVFHEANGSRDTTHLWDEMVKRRYTVTSIMPTAARMSKWEVSRRGCL